MEKYKQITRRELLKEAALVVGGVAIGSIPLLNACTLTPTSLYTLSVSVNPSGGGIVSTPGGKYHPGTKVTLTATPNSGYDFEYWDGSITGSAPTVTITMSSDKSITAHFRDVNDVV